MQLSILYLPPVYYVIGVSTPGDQVDGWFIVVGGPMGVRESIIYIPEKKAREEKKGKLS